MIGRYWRSGWGCIYEQMGAAGAERWMTVRFRDGQRTHDTEGRSVGSEVGGSELYKLRAP